MRGRPSRIRSQTSTHGPSIPICKPSLAAEKGRARESLVVKAAGRMVKYEEWFLREVNAGLAAAERANSLITATLRK